MDFKDYYKIMGVERDADQTEIKRAYRKLARKYHPDVSKEDNAEERFKDVGEAYEVLRDPEKRAAYDQLGANWKSGQDFHPPPDWDAGFEYSGGGFTANDASAFSDFFESLFGRKSGSGQAGRGHAGFHVGGENHFAKAFIDLEDAYNGVTRTILLHAPEQSDGGHVIVKNRTLNVKIPKGIKQGQRIRLTGQGGPGLGGGKAGDLYLEILFNPHRIYRVDGHDVYLDLPVTPWEAALGATVLVPTPEGSVELKIPLGTASGRKLRLKGRGIPGKPSGDLYVVPQVTLPPADSETAREIYRRMELELPYNPRSKLGA